MERKGSGNPQEVLKGAMKPVEVGVNTVGSAASGVMRVLFREGDAQHSHGPLRSLVISEVSKLPQPLKIVIFEAIGLSPASRN